MTDFSQMLLDQLKQSNLAQTQLANDYTKQANMMANMPKEDPMNSYMGALGMGIAGAPSNVGTLEAIGQAMPAAQGAYQQSHQNNMNRQVQAMEFKRLSASTLNAVAKFNLEYGLKREQLSRQSADSAESKRHNEAIEKIQMMKATGKPSLEESVAKSQIMDLIKTGDQAELDKGAIDKQLKAALNTNRFNKSEVIAAGKSLDSSNRADTSSYLRSSDDSAKELSIKNIVNGTLGYMTKKYLKEGYSYPEVLKLINQKKSEVVAAAEREVSGENNE